MIRLISNTFILVKAFLTSNSSVQCDKSFLVLTIWCGHPSGGVTETPSLQAALEGTSVPAREAGKEQKEFHWGNLQMIHIISIPVLLTCTKCSTVTIGQTGDCLTVCLGQRWSQFRAQLAVVALIQYYFRWWIPWLKKKRSFHFLPNPRSVQRSISLGKNNETVADWQGDDCAAHRKMWAQQTCRKCLSPISFHDSSR